MMQRRIAVFASATRNSVASAETPVIRGFRAAAHVVFHFKNAKFCTANAFRVEFL
jgi:hypothetical protein